MNRTSFSKNRGSVRNGLISLLVVIAVLLLATIAVLTVSTSHAMKALAQRQATMTDEGYDAETSAQNLLALLDEELASMSAKGTTGAARMAELDSRVNQLLVSACVDGVSGAYLVDGNTLTCTFTTQNGRVLEITLAIGENASYNVIAWRLTAALDTDTGDMLWTGSSTGE